MRRRHDAESRARSRACLACGAARRDRGASCGPRHAGRRDGRHARRHPASRRFDIAIEQDLIEEVGRIHGYDNIPAQRREMPRRPQPSTERAVTRERLRLLLVDRGYQEVVTYGFVDPRLQRLMFPGRKAACARESPVDGTRRDACLAVSGTGRDAAFNQRGSERVRIFEVGTRFEMSAGRLRRKPGHRRASHRAGAARAVGRQKSRGGFLRSKIGCRGSVRADRPRGCNKLHRRGARRFASRAQCRDFRRQGSHRLYGQLQPELCAGWTSWPALGFRGSDRPSFRAGSCLVQGAVEVPAIRRDLAVWSAVTGDPGSDADWPGQPLLRDLAVFDVYRGRGSNRVKRAWLWA